MRPEASRTPACIAGGASDGARTVGTAASLCDLRKSPARTQTGAGLLSAEAVALAAGASAPATSELAASLLRTGPDPFDCSDVPLVVAPPP